jgi:hypothetical protein
MLAEGFSQEIISQFINGFPTNWASLLVDFFRLRFLKKSDESGTIDETMARKGYEPAIGQRKSVDQIIKEENRFPVRTKSAVPKKTLRSTEPPTSTKHSNVLECARMKIKKVKTRLKTSPAKWKNVSKVKQSSMTRKSSATMSALEKRPSKSADQKTHYAPPECIYPHANPSVQGTLQLTRSGRTVGRPLEYWRLERKRYDVHGNVIELLPGRPENVDELNRKRHRFSAMAMSSAVVGPSATRPSMATTIELSDLDCLSETTRHVHQRIMGKFPVFLSNFFQTHS